jgi:hypothetical protein
MMTLVSFATIYFVPYGVVAAKSALAEPGHRE